MDSYEPNKTFYLSQPIIEKLFKLGAGAEKGCPAGVPEGMSCVNAFRALWENSKPAAFFMIANVSDSPQAATVSTAEKVADLFRKSTYFDYQGGRMLKTDFANFPQLDARLYDRDFGAGAAQKAIAAYNAKPSDERFDKGDSYKFEDLVSKKA